MVEAISRDLLQQTIFEPILSQSAAACIYDPLQYIDIVIYACVVGPPVITLISYASSRVVETIFFHSIYQHYVNVLATILFRISFVIFTLGTVIYLMLSTILPEAVQACSSLS